MRIQRNVCQTCLMRKRCMANDREKIEDKANELVVNVISSGFLTTPCFNWTKKMLKS